MIPVKVVGCGLPVQLLYWDMKRLGVGLESDREKTIPSLVVNSIIDAVENGMVDLFQNVKAIFNSFLKVQKE